jgi:DNA-binding beta-propeller fold protein YncE
MNAVGARLVGFRMCVLAVLAICASACNLDNPGFSPPPGRITYPIALALSIEPDGGAPSYLYVANANFDLKYNGGSVHAYDLVELQRLLDYYDCWEPLPEQPVPDAGPAPDGGAGLDAGDTLDGGEGEPEGGDELDGGTGEPDAEGDLDAGEPEDAEPDADAGPVDSHVPQPEPDANDLVTGRDTQRGTLCDGRRTQPDEYTACCFGYGEGTPLDTLRTSEVIIDSYASGLGLSQDGAHLYATVRGQTRLVHLDVNGGELSCGNQAERCRRGPALGATGETEDSEFMLQPTAIVTGTLGELGTAVNPSRGYVATTHELGSISLFGTDSSGAPELLDSMQMYGPNGNLRRVVSISKDRSGLLLVAAASENSVARVGARRPAEIAANEDSEGADDDERQYLHVYETWPLGINGLSSAQDVRDAQEDTRATPEGRPQRYYALLRGSLAPPPNVVQSVAFLELPAGQDDGRYARLVDAVRVGLGPSKLEQLDLGDRHLLLASCYEEGAIYVIDADTRQILTVVREISGPFEMQPDPVRQLLYVGDFRASVVRVIDLRGLVDREKPLPRIVATLGAPTFTGGIK